MSPDLLSLSCFVFHSPYRSGSVWVTPAIIATTVPTFFQTPESFDTQGKIHFFYFTAPKNR